VAVVEDLPTAFITREPEEKRPRSCCGSVISGNYGEARRILIASVGAYLIGGHAIRRIEDPSIPNLAVLAESPASPEEMQAGCIAEPGWLGVFDV
jgi:hypothetical protein